MDEKNKAITELQDKIVGALKISAKKLIKTKQKNVNPLPFIKMAK